VLTFRLKQGLWFSNRLSFLTLAGGC
jgi:hypothetical protein